PADRAAHHEQVRIILDLAHIDEVIEFASVESFDINRRASALRTGVAELFGALVAGSHTMPMVRAAAEDAVTTALTEVLRQFEQRSPSPDAGTRRELLEIIRAARATLVTLAREDGSKIHILALAHARELLDRLSRAVRAVGEDAKAGPIRLRPYLDWRTAMRNGLRAMIAMGLGSLFWIVTAWPSGGSMLAVLGVACGLLATNPSAGAASVDFAKGMVLSSVCAFLCTFGILTHVDGFPLLALSLLPVVAGGAYASTNPRLTPMMVPLLTFFLPLVAPTNPIHYDIVAFFNTALAYIFGSICAAFAFRIILPPDPGLNVRRLCNSIARDVQRLGRAGPVPGRLPWEHRQHQKLAQLVGRLREVGEAQREAVLVGACAAITVGSAAIQVRAALAAGTIPAPAAAAAEGAIGLLRDLRAGAAAAAIRSTELSRQLAGAPYSDDLVRVAGAFQRIGTLIQQHQHFFRQPGIAVQDDVTC
ncbi:MAG TPA: FUSC family protein, partial [Rhodopila sp.]